MISQLFVAVAVALLTCTTFLTPLSAAEPNDSRYIEDVSQNFTKNLLQLISTRKPRENLVYSPISLETILALIYTGSSGQTADELRTALGLPEDETPVYQRFGDLMKSRRTETMELQMVNQIYFMEGLEIMPSFRMNAQRYFDAELDGVWFPDSERTANSINQWMAWKTNNKISNLVNPDSLDEDTYAILVNAIYFQAKWLKEFSSQATSCDWFYMNSWEMGTVEMMYKQDTFNFADLSNELGASVLQIPYADSDLSMLLVLPNDVEGLAEVESRLRDIDLRKLPQQMKKQKVDLQIPKFRIEFELDMKKILQKLQITSLFKDYSGLDGIFGQREPAVISEVKHKAFIEVNEAGSEPAAATSMDGIQVSPSLDQVPFIFFTVDHPFMFAIISPQAVYFVGHIVNPPLNCKKM